MKRLLLKIALLGMLASQALAQGYNSALTTVFTAPGTSNSINQNTRIGFHQLGWTVTGSPAACQLQLDSSPDGVTWTTGTPISGTACTLNGTTSVFSGNPVYLRVNVTALSNGGVLTVFYTGWSTSPTGSGSLPAGTVVSGSNITFPGDVTTQATVAHQPFDSLTFFGNPILDPSCSVGWDWDTNNPPNYLEVCFDTIDGVLTYRVADGGQNVFYGGALNAAAHTFYGNNAGTAAPNANEVIGTQDVTPQFAVGFSGPSNAYSGCPIPAITSLGVGTAGLLLNINSSTIAGNNSGASTLTVCGIGPKSIVKNGATGLVALSGGELQIHGGTCGGGIGCNSYQFQWDQPDNVWVLLNPTTTSGNGTATFIVTPVGQVGNTAAAFVQNVHNLTSFVAPASIAAATNIYYKVATADNTANLYDIGIADTNGNILCHTGALAGTTLTPGTGFKNRAFTGGCTLALTSGSRYYIDVTTNCAASCAAFGGNSSTITQFIGPTGTTSGGALANFTPPADNITNNIVISVALQ